MKHLVPIAAASLIALGCTSTTDSLGTNGNIAPPLPNTFGTLLGKSQAEVDAKLAAAFDQLFYGDPDTEAIYFPVDPDQAYIFNALAREIRTDGFGYALLVTVELDRPDEFGRLWRYAAEHLQYQTGPAERFLYWECGATGGCPDPNGMQYAAAALLLAGARWAEPAYTTAGQGLLQVMLHREALNGGVVGDVHNVFDATSRLPVTTPMGDPTSTTTSFLLPAFNQLFAATSGGDAATWQDVANATRAALTTVTATPTGLPPDTANLAGMPLTTTFSSEAYRVGLNMAVDHLAFGTSFASEANALLTFFATRTDGYYGEYDIETGAALANWESSGLRAALGATAAAATTDDRARFVQAVWDMPVPTGVTRYYDGVLYLLSLLTLSGKVDLRAVPAGG